MKRAASLALAVCAATACASPGEPQPAAKAPAAMPAAPAAAAAAASLAGTRWIGVVDAGADPQSIPRLEFVGSRLTGFSGCNLMSGAWRTEGGEVRFSNVVTTRRACVGAGGEIERRLLAAMGEASRVRREGGRLVIEAPGGARFEFTQVPS
jgi:heat shock protein HslJ